MASPSLHQIVKGAPAPDSSLNKDANSQNLYSHPVPRAVPRAPAVLLANSIHHASRHDHSSSLHQPLHPPPAPVLNDPTSLLPSSPPQIYLNLLILEASLRSQYLTLRARRRQNTFVLSLLAVWIGFCTYLLWLRPRDDGKGIGGSGYWLVDMLQKVGFITGVVTALLFWATGQWERGVRWPRRWIGVANRGLRGMNAKIVLIRGPWWRELMEWLYFVVPFSGGLWGGEQSGSSYHFINVAQEQKHSLHGGRPRHKIVEDGKEYAEEDIAPGGDYIKLLLLPKPFTPDFRQEWELYRNEYWATENERRAELRKRVRARQREIARDQGGWLWWTGWRGWKRARGLSTRAASRRRRTSTLSVRGREAYHSHNSSRSTTPGPDWDMDSHLRPFEPRERRWSSSSNTTTGSTPMTAFNSLQNPLRSPKNRSSITQGNAQSARQLPPRASLSGSRPSTPGEGTLPWQNKRLSTLSNAESISGSEDADSIHGESPPPRPQTKQRGSRERERRADVA